MTESDSVFLLIRRSTTGFPLILSNFHPNLWKPDFLTFHQSEVSSSRWQECNIFSRAKLWGENSTIKYNFYEIILPQLKEAKKFFYAVGMSREASGIVELVRRMDVVVFFFLYASSDKVVLFVGLVASAGNTNDDRIIMNGTWLEISTSRKNLHFESSSMWRRAIE